MIRAIIHVYRVRRWTRLYWKYAALADAAKRSGDSERVIRYSGKAALYCTRAVFR